MSDRYSVLSGCSGGGKSTLLEELRRRGHSVVEEPGRRVVKAELESGGGALPWIDLAAFARRALATSIRDREAAAALPGRVFFDRSIVDAAVALEHATGEAALDKPGWAHRYHASVFLTPPWPEIFAADPERKHGFDEAVAEYDRLRLAYPKLGYRVIVLPRTDVATRADLVLSQLAGIP